MPYAELEEWLDRGAIRAVWRLTWKTFAGVGIGAVLGMQVGTLVYGAGLAVGGLTLLGAALGWACMRQRRGMVAVKRLWIRLQFWLRVLRKQTELDGRVYGVVRDEPQIAPVMRVRARRPGGGY